jgi:hypothetical protein
MPLTVDCQSTAATGCGARLDSRPPRLEYDDRYTSACALLIRLQLAELVIHQQDVRRAVGLARHIPSERITVVLNSGLTQWVGTGAEVRGSGEALLMAMSGPRVEQPVRRGCSNLQRSLTTPSPD